MEGLKEYWNSWWVDKDGRKHETYPLKRGSIGRTANNRDKYRIRKPAVSRNVRYEIDRKGEPAAVDKPSTAWSKIKSIFDSTKKDIKDLKHAYADYRLPSADPSTTQVEINRIVANEKFKQKLLERRYEQTMLDELRRGRKKYRRKTGGLPGSTVEPALTSSINHADEVILLRKKIDDLEKRLSAAVEELVIAKKKLEFAQEKNSLLEELFEDGNMETEYVKSRRNMTNLQNSERKPELKQLPRSPSPVRNVNPMFTSSPIRGTLNPTANTNPSADAVHDSFYEKYPKIPETERLGSYFQTAETQQEPHNSDDPEHSLSPVRVDYSKYSGL